MHARGHGRRQFRDRLVPVRLAIGCCAVSSLLGAGGAIAAATLPTGPPVKPGPPFVIAGYGYTCQSTSRTPNWSCEYGRPYGPSGTPIMTVFKGSRTMIIQSLT
jgi:hypothetical protein